jgi:hypothetical protein
MRKATSAVVYHRRLVHHRRRDRSKSLLIVRIVNLHMQRMYRMLLKRINVIPVHVKRRVQRMHRRRKVA